MGARQSANSGQSTTRIPLADPPTVATPYPRVGIKRNAPAWHKFS